MICSLFRLWRVGAAWLSGFLLLTPLALAQENAGFGPLPWRNQFPLALRWLNLTPEGPLVLKPGQWNLGYQLAIANTFLNTRGQSGDLSPGAVKRGLQNDDFYIHQIQQPHNGFNLYIDVESYRHLWRVARGFPGNWQVALEWSLLSFGSGWMDGPIEAIHTLTRVDNREESGGFRAKSPRNRFDYYLIRNDRFIFRERRAFDLAVGDPTWEAKWNLTRGNMWWPALSLKLAYKSPWDRASHFPRQLISTGRMDYGLYAIASKALGNPHWFLYLQTGQTMLGREGSTFRPRLYHFQAAFEYRSSPHQAWLAQWAHQSSLFPGSSKPLPESFREKVIDRGLGKPTDVLTLGWQYQNGKERYHLGIMEDLNQTRNEIDFAMVLGVNWSY